MSRRSLFTLLIAGLLLLSIHDPGIAQDDSVSIIPALKARQRYTQVTLTTLKQSRVIKDGETETIEPLPDLLALNVRESEILKTDAAGTPLQTRVWHVFQSEFIVRGEDSSIGITERRRQSTGTVMRYERPTADEFWEGRFLTDLPLADEAVRKMKLSGMKSTAPVFSGAKLQLGGKYQGELRASYYFRGGMLANFCPWGWGGDDYELEYYVPSGTSALEIELASATGKNDSGDETLDVTISGEIETKDDSLLKVKAGALRSSTDTASGWGKTTMKGVCSVNLRLGVPTSSVFDFSSSVEGTRTTDDGTLPLTLQIECQRRYEVFEGGARQVWPRILAERTKAGEVPYVLAEQAQRQYAAFCRAYGPTVRRIDHRQFYEDDKLNMETWSIRDAGQVKGNKATTRKTASDKDFKAVGAETEDETDYEGYLTLPGRAAPPGVTRSTETRKIGGHDFDCIHEVVSEGENAGDYVYWADCPKEILWGRSKRQGVDVVMDWADYRDATDASPEEKLKQMRDDAAALLQTEEHTESEVEVQHLLVAFKDAVPGVERSKEDAEKLAAELYARVRAGEDFDALVKQYTNDSHPGIYAMKLEGELEKGVEVYPRKGMVPAFGNTAWRLQIGEVGVAAYSEKDSKYGWHIIRRLR
ncbi:MAG: peptidylprolyl isomerase [Planctomycetes bacterium]|nr:peptidylprolyl isomerase [Planctomycetota bacterium]